ncbi:DUF1573 domain-containing protein [Geothrix sp. 21YS21S-2]|uniref:DUF1573 domain-containing protein n=1 Tax=Geothrix sp. 21YS21S-2 TaxID=3068893 RepID=UPI0027B89F83|nr:DUF1573 domain-containing protein [Geothrix sp. 21YS21S-2]
MRPALIAVLMPALCFAQAPPRMVLDTLRHDFGKVERESTSRFRFKVTNAGGGPLRILGVKPSCGCTSTVVGKEILLPGESTELEVAFMAAGLRGEVTKFVEIHSDDPANPIQTLTLKAEVRMDVLIGQDIVFFQDLKAKDRRKAVVKLESATGQPIRIDDVQLSPAPWLGVATRESGTAAFLDLVLVADRLPSEKFSGTDFIDLHLSNPRESVITVRVNWDRRMPILASPARVALAGKAGLELYGRMVVKHRQGKPFRVLSARTTSSLLSVPTLPGGAAPSHAIKVVLSGAASPGTYDEKVILGLDDPSQRFLEVRVTAAVD